ncbi:hypothetical protein ACWF94_25740 [Streptomyces sp. NPDC055078]
MANLPEDILDRIKNLERQVQRLTTYIHTRQPAALPAPLASPEAGEPAPAQPEPAPSQSDRPGPVPPGEGAPPQG